MHRHDGRLAGVEPVALDPQREVVAARLLEDEGPRAWMGGVIEVHRDHLRRPGVGVDEGFEKRQPARGLDQPPFLVHLLPGLRVRVDRRPDRHHQLDTHAAQLGDHPCRVRPVCRFEAPLALLRPVEEVDDDAGQRQATPVVLACHGKQLLLVVVSQLALPEATGPGRERRRAARGLCVAVQQFGRSSRTDPVVELVRGLGHPTGQRVAELGAPDGRAVPEKAIATAADHPRDVDLAIALQQLEHAALLVEQPMLALAHAVEPLVRCGLEGGLDAPALVCQSRVVARPRPLEMGALFGEQLAARGRLDEAQLQFLPRLAMRKHNRDLAPQTAVRHGSTAALDVDHRTTRLLRQQGRERIVAEGAGHRRSNTQAFAPGLDEQRLAV